jgi:hypothetical protein
MMTNRLRVVGLETGAGLPALLKLDGIVPLEFWTCMEVPGCAYLRLGSTDASLLELGVAYHDRVVRGLTLIQVDALSAWPSFEVRDRATGLPILCTTFSGYEVRDMRCELRVATQGLSVLLFWSDLRQCESFDFGTQTSFLVQDRELCAVQVALSESEFLMFAEAVGGTNHRDKLGARA